jgi:hypothetical protein
MKYINIQLVKFSRMSNACRIDQIIPPLQHEPSYRGTELKKSMTDNLKVKASKAVDDARVAAHAAYDDVTVAAHNALKEAGTDAQKASDDVKMGVHKAVADARIAAHEAGSKIRKL